MPARPIKSQFVSNTGIASASSTIAAGGSVSTKLTQGFPTGDALLHSLFLRHSGNLNLTATTPGAIIADGGHRNLRGLWLSTPQHGVLYNGPDGLSLSRLEFYASKSTPVATDPDDADTGTPTFEFERELAFRDPEGARPVDCSLDLFRVSYLELVYNVGGASDYISGGTYTTETIQVLNLEIDADIDPGPVDPENLPAFRPYVDSLRIPVAQTQTNFQVILPYGGRLIMDYLIEQRNGSTLAPLANTVVGAADTDRISMLVGGYPWVNRLEWLALQNRCVKKLRLPSECPTGSAVLNWAQRDTRGYLASEFLGLSSEAGATPQTELNLDTTSVTNGQLWITTRARTPIPVDARRPATAAPASA